MTRSCFIFKDAIVYLENMRNYKITEISIKMYKGADL